MRRRLVLLVLLLGAAVGVTVLISSEGADNVRPPGGRAPTSAVDSQVPTPGLVDVAPAEAQPDALVPAQVAGSVEADPGEQWPTWRGIVTDVQGRPLAGARVLRLPTARTLNFTSHLPAPENPSLLTDAASCEAGLDGAFALAFAPPPEDTDWSLLIRHPTGLARLVKCTGTLERGGDCGTIALEPACLARGRVLAADGSPAAGADIDGRLLPYSASPIGGDALWITGLRDGLLHERADADGRFELGGLPVASLSLNVQHIGCAPLRTEDRSLSLAGLCDFGELRLQRGGTVSGRVLDAQGRPLAGAEVRLLDPDLEVLKLWDHGVHAVLERARTGGWDHGARAEARACFASTDSEGRFEVCGLTRPLCGVVAAAQGFEPAAVDAVPSGTRDLVLRLEPLGELTLRLLDGRGALLADAELQVQRVASETFRAYADEDALPVERVGAGEFRVRDVCASPLVARVSSPGVGLIGLRLQGLAPADPAETRDVHVPLPVSISGRVLDTAGQPLGTARIRFAPYSWDSQPIGLEWGETAVAPDGSFRLGPLPADDWTLVAQADGRASAQARRTLAPGEAADVGDLVLPLLAYIDARFLGAHGEPSAGVELRAVAAEQPVGSALVLESGTTDADGRLRMQLAPVAARLESRKPPTVVDLGTLAEGETRSVLLQEHSAVRLSGTVRSAGEPVAKALMSFKHAGGTLKATTDESGQWAMDVPGGVSGRLSARSPRGGCTSCVIELRPGEVRVVDQSFGTQRLRGRVLQESTGAPLPGTKVQAWTEEPKLVGATVSVADDGTFELADMEDGAWVVQAFGEGLTFSEEVTVPIPAGAASAVLLHVERLASVTGRVLTDAGVPVGRRQATLYLLPSGSGDPESATLDDAGNFEFKRVTPGDFELVVTGGLGMHQRPWHQRDPVERLAWLRIPLRVAPGQVVTQDVILPSGRP